MANTLQDLLQEQLKVRARVVESDVTVLTTLSATEIVKPNPNRVAIVISNTGSYDFYYSVEKSMGATSGILIKTDGGFVSRNWRDDLQAPAYGHYGVAVGTATTVHIEEIIIG